MSDPRSCLGGMAVVLIIKLLGLSYPWEIELKPYILATSSRFEFLTLDFIILIAAA